MGGYIPLGEIKAYLDLFPVWDREAFALLMRATDVMVVEAFHQKPSAGKAGRK